ncbi:MAG: universal stress protein [Bacteroidales bacterium]|nr:universal stress protein [Bacteroidales bacterium]
MCNKKILIPTDYSDICYNAVSYGLEFCRHYGYEAEFFHVNTNNNYDEQGKIKNEELAKLYSEKFNIKYSFVEKKGDLFEAISQEIKSNEFLFMILGTYGKNGIQLLMGSLAAKIIDFVNVPVLVVQSKKFVPFNSIVWPVSRLSGNGKGVSKIIEMASALNAKLHMVYRTEGFETARIFQKAFSNKVDFVLENFDESKYNGTFVTQVLGYCQHNDINMITTVSNEVKMTTFDTRYEQFLFNIDQIPVLCVGRN